MLSVAELRTLTGILPKNPAARDVLPLSGLETVKGIPRSALTEISGAHGAGKTELVLRFLSENPEVRVAWIEEQFTVYPCAFPQRGVGLKRVLFAEAGKNLMWAVHQIVRSRLFKVVVMGCEACEGSHERTTELRRLQIAAEQAGVSVILLTEKPTMQGAWPITLQVAVRRPHLRVIKQRSLG